MAGIVAGERSSSITEPPGGAGNEEQRPGERVGEDDRQVELDATVRLDTHTLRITSQVLADEERPDVGPPVPRVQRRVPGNDDREDDERSEREHHLLHPAK